MHGYGPGSGILVDAEADSMGGVVDGEVGIEIKTSPRQAAIEKAQAELRQEYDVREERRRELEFLEKGGNPLDFKFGNGTSLSVQSTSFTDQHVEHLVNSEAKGSFVLTASPHGDSMDSIGRPGPPTSCEPNTADNFDGENELLPGQKKTKLAGRRSVVGQSEHSGQMDGGQNVKESDDSAFFRPYARRNRSRPNRDGSRAISSDIVQVSGVLRTPLVRGASIDTKGLVPEKSDLKNVVTHSSSIPKFPTSNGESCLPTETPDTLPNSKLIGDANTICSSSGTLSREQPEVTESSKNVEQEILKLETSPNVSLPQVSEANNFEEKENAIVGNVEIITADVKMTPEVEPVSSQCGIFDQVDETEAADVSVALCRKDSESSCSLKNVGLETNNGNVLAENQVVDEVSCSDGKESSDVEVLHKVVVNDAQTENNDDSSPVINTESALPKHSSSFSAVDVLDSDVHNDIGEKSNIERMDDALDPSALNTAVDTVTKENAILMDFPIQEPHESKSTKDCSFLCSEHQSLPDKTSKIDERSREDSVLEKARTIEAKRKRIAELSTVSVSFENRRKSQWDFVLEEMAWLANDFAQERLWKMTAASQICRRVALSSRMRFVEQKEHKDMKRVAYSLAKAVMNFWQSADMYSNAKRLALMKNGKLDREGVDAIELQKNQCVQVDEEKLDVPRGLDCQKANHSPIWQYAERFLMFNCLSASVLQAEAPTTPDRTADYITTDLSWDDHLTEESLFYSIPSSAMQIYRCSIESHVMQFEKTGSIFLEEVDTSMHDSMGEFCYSDNQFAEEEGEINNYYMHGSVDGRKMMKYDQRKPKNFARAFSVRSYEQRSDVPFGDNMVFQDNIVLGKRSANNYSVGPVPPKRSRTVSRQRVIAPLNTGTPVPVQALSKMDASSGDTSSFQDDQSTMHGGSQNQKSIEVESAEEFEKQLPYDYSESTRTRKKKKTKQLDSAYDHMWQLDSGVSNNDQKESSKKRLENFQFESNGTSGLYGQPIVKKPKLVKQSAEGAFDSMTPMPVSVPSPAASQMSNMSNTNKFIKMFNGRERGRKSKSLKITSGQSDSTNPWSMLEDQALVVLVHDMGPNWELVSDAINNTLQFKCIFRKPKDCKERHKILMDKGASDGADSAEDSGSSQSYPSTLPGIPKGSARQLFQRLQGPVEEDTLKSHFERIIMIGKKLHCRRNQNDNLDGTQPMPPHKSHMIAPSPTSLNSHNGGILTPLDLCDPNLGSSDVLSLGYSGTQSNNLVISGQGSAPALPTSAANISLPGSNITHGNNSQSPSVQHSSAVRDGRYNASRASLPVDEQQRVQHYNKILSARNMQQQHLSVSGSLPGTDRGGVRLLPGGNGMGMMPGVNRNVSIPRPGFQGMTSSSMINSGSMNSSNVPGVQNPATLHSGSASSSGNSMIRSGDAMQIMRPGPNAEPQRQLISPEHQMPTTQGSVQGISSFNGMSSAYANQAIPPAAQNYPGHQQYHQMSPQQPHALSNPHLQGTNHTPASQQQAFAIRLAKERQRLLQQQQQQLAAPMMPHVQNSNQSAVQPSSQAVSLSPATPSSPMSSVSVSQQQKHNGSHHALGRNLQAGTSVLTNQGVKQRQRQHSPQQCHQSGRNHPQQRQLSHSPQSSKVSKGVGRGNIMVHQNLVDHSHLNGLSLPPGSQGLEKGEQMMNMIQGQGMYSAPNLGMVQTSKAMSTTANHSQSPQKHLSTSTSLPKPTQILNSESCNQGGQALPISSSHVISSHQAAPSSSMVSNTSHLQTQIHQKQIGQSQQSISRVIPPGHKINSDLLTKSVSDQNHTDHQMANNVSLTSPASGIQASCSDSVAGVSVSQGFSQPWNQPESLLDSVLSNSASQMGPMNSPVAHSSGNEATSSINLGVNQRQISGNMPQHGLVAMSKVAPSQQFFHSQEQQMQQESQSPRKQLPFQ